MPPDTAAHNILRERLPVDVLGALIAAIIDNQRGENAAMAKPIARRASIYRQRARQLAEAATREPRETERRHLFGLAAMHQRIADDLASEKSLSRQQRGNLDERIVAVESLPHDFLRVRIPPPKQSAVAAVPPQQPATSGNGAAPVTNGATPPSPARWAIKSIAAPFLYLRGLRSMAQNYPGPHPPQKVFARLSSGTWIGLTDSQLRVVMDAAATVPVEKRSVYLQRIAAMLTMRERGHFNDADVSDVAKLALTGLAQQPGGLSSAVTSLRSAGPGSTRWRART